MQNKIRTKYHFIWVKLVHIIKVKNGQHWWKCEEKRPSSIAGGKVNWSNLFGKKILMYKLISHLIQKLYCLAFASRTQNFFRKGVCTPMLIAALKIIAKSWKQPKRPKLNDRINIFWNKNGILLSYKKKLNHAMYGYIDGYGKVWYVKWMRRK